MILAIMDIRLLSMKFIDPLNIRYRGIQLYLVIVVANRVRPSIRFTIIP